MPGRKLARKSGPFSKRPETSSGSPEVASSDVVKPVTSATSPPSARSTSQPGRAGLWAASVSIRTVSGDQRSSSMRRISPSGRPCSAASRPGERRRDGGTPAAEGAKRGRCPGGSWRLHRRRSALASAGWTQRTWRSDCSARAAGRTLGGLAGDDDRLHRGIGQHLLQVADELEAGTVPAQSLDGPRATGVDEQFMAAAGGQRAGKGEAVGMVAEERETHSWSPRGEELFRRYCMDSSDGILLSPRRRRSGTIPVNTIPTSSARRFDTWPTNNFAPAPRPRS